jgi:hypothetical protein
MPVDNQKLFNKKLRLLSGFEVILVPKAHFVRMSRYCVMFGIAKLALRLRSVITLYDPCSSGLFIRLT